MQSACGLTPEEIDLMWQTAVSNAPSRSSEISSKSLPDAPYFADMMLLLLLISCLGVQAASPPHKAPLVLLEAEQFANLGGWVVDQQFMDQMGSPYLLAHGLGEPVLPLSKARSGDGG
jgi:hypothetical protein